MSFPGYFFLRQELDRCELFPNKQDQILCKASVLARAERRGMRGVYQFSRVQTQVAEQQRAAITSNTLLIVGLLIGGAILLSRK